MSSSNGVIRGIEAISEENRANLRRLSEQLRTELGVIPFVGAGLSIPCGFPGWTDFLLSRAQPIGLADKIGLRIQAGEYEEAAEDLQSALGFRAFEDSLDQAYGDHRLPKSALEGAVSLLPRLASGPVITTNFDHALEQAFARSGCGFERVVLGAKSGLLVKGFHQNGKFLLKIHGDVEDATERILTLTQYSQHYGAGDVLGVNYNLPLPKLIRLMLMSRPILFLGCSLIVDRTVGLLGRIAEEFPAIAHYAIVELPDIEGERIQRAKHLSNLGIRPIWYPAGRHDLIEPLLGYLADCIPAHLRPVAASRPNRALDIPFFLPQNDTPTFTGRGEELRRLESLLLNRKGKKLCSIVGLAGTGGVGKSALACHFAERYKNEFPGGVIGLRVDDKDLDTIVRDFARCIKEEIDPDDQRDASTLMQEMFRNRRALLIFDNAENPEIRSLHPGGDLCAVILTTRDRMLPLLIDIPAEGRIDLSVLPKSKAFKLLRRLIGDKRIAAEVKASIEVTGHVGCLPLALQIAGAALQMQAWPSIAEYADALREERLEVLRVRGNEHLDVRASFSLSLKFLEAEELDFFACLSVCAQDGFSLKAAVAATGHDKASAQQRLAYLYRLSLLNQAITGTGRYVFHPLIGSFAREIADERGLRDSAAERHAGFYTELIRSSDINDPEAASIIAAELDDILLAEQWRQQHELANDEILIRLQPFFQRAGHWQKAVKLISGSMSTAERKEDWRLLAQLYIQQAKYLSLQGDLGSAEETLAPVDEMLGKIEAQQVRRRCEAMLLNTRGGIFQRRGRFDDAVKAFEQSAVIEEELGNDHGQATVLNSLGGVLQRQGQFDKAVEAFQRSYDSLIQTGDERGQAMVLTSLGGVEQRMGQFENAANHFRSAIEIEERQGNSRGLAIVLNSLGGVLQRQGKLDEAEAAFRRSSVLEDQLGDKRGQAMVLNSLGGVLQRQGKLDKAEAAFRRSSEIGEALGDNRHLAMVLNSLGGVLKRQGRFDEAAEAFEQSYELLVELNDQRGQAMVLNSLGGVLQRQGKFDEAVDAFQRSLVISEEQNDQQSIAMRLNSLGGVLQRQGRFDEAEAAFRQSYAISELLGDQRSLAMVLNSLGDVLQRQGRFDEALEALNRSCSIFEKSKDLRSQAMVKFTLGKTFLSKGDVDKAVSALIKSFEINEKLRDKQGLAIVLLILVPVLRRLGRHKDASGILDRALKIDPQSNRLKNLKR